MGTTHSTDIADAEITADGIAMLARMQAIIQGDPAELNHDFYGIPPLNPLVLAEPIHIVHRSPRLDIDLWMRTVSLHSFNTIRFEGLEGFRQGLHNKTYKVRSVFDHLPMKFDYRMSFREESECPKQLESNGRAEFNCGNVRVSVKYDVLPYVNPANNVKCMEVANFEAYFLTGSSSSQFTGNWGAQLKVHFDKNWPHLLSILQPQINAAIDKAFQPILNNIAKKLPWNDYFRN